MYYYGKGIEQNYRVAAEWYKKAADQKYAFALAKLAEMHLSGEGVEKSQPKAGSLYDEACFGGFQSACDSLAKLNKKNQH